MSVPSKPRWRWKWLSSSGSPLRLNNPETIEETLSWYLSCEEDKEKKSRHELPAVCFAAANRLPQRYRTVPSIWWNSEEYTQATTLTIHSLKAKSNVSICVEERISALTFEQQFPWNSLSIHIKGMKRSDFQRKMCFNLTIPNMFQYKMKRKRGEKTKSGTMWESVRFISSLRVSWKVLCSWCWNVGFGNLSQSRDFRLAYLVLSRFQSIQNRFINNHHIRAEPVI